MSVAGSDMVLGAISFGHALAHDWRDDEPSLREMYDAACRTIVRMECEAAEREARIAVLEEEQKILAKRFDARLHAVGTTAEAKAAVIEGAERPCNDSAYALRERPEPSPQFRQPAQDALAEAESTPETLSCVAWATDVSGWPTYLVVNALVAQKLERERNALSARVAELESKYACRLTDEEWVEEKRAECEADKICGHPWGNL